MPWITQKGELDLLAPYTTHGPKSLWVTVFRQLPPRTTAHSWAVSKCGVGGPVGRKSQSPIHARRKRNVGGVMHRSNLAPSREPKKKRPQKTSQHQAKQKIKGPPKRASPKPPKNRAQPKRQGPKPRLPPAPLRSSGAQNAGLWGQRAGAEAGGPGHPRGATCGPLIDPLVKGSSPPEFMNFKLFGKTSLVVSMKFELFLANQLRKRGSNNGGG